MKYPCYVVELKHSVHRVDKIVDANYNVIFVWDQVRGWDNWLGRPVNLKRPAEKGLWNVIKTMNSKSDLFTELL